MRDAYHQSMDSASVALDDLDGLSVAELKERLHEQHALLVAKDAQIRSYAVELQELKLQLLKLRRLQFGSRSEKRAQEIAQLELWVEELETAEAQREYVLAERVGTSPARVAKPRRVLPDHLPREIEVVAPDATCCPQCGGDLAHLSDDVSDMLEFAPARFFVKRCKRPKLACTRCDTIVQAPAPSRPIERGMAGPGLLAHVLVGKYADHVPLHRQSEIYGREGVDLERSLLAQWVGNMTALLRPLIDALSAHVFAADVVHADDTPIPVLAPGRGKTKTGRLWTYVRDERPAGGRAAPAVWFAYAADRKGEHPQRHLETFRGILQADGYAGYSKIYDNGQVVEAACWAHARRKFVDLHQLHNSPIAGEGLDRIGALYAIEQKIRGRPPNERRLQRQKHSRPLLDDLHRWMQATLRPLSQKSATAKALQYALSRWEALGRFCDDGRIEIDNNAAERALRCVALGRKNFLFAGSDAGGDRAAALYSLLGTAKLNGVNPEAFLREVLTRIADLPIGRIAELLPWNLKAIVPHLAIDSAPQLATSA